MGKTIEEQRNKQRLARKEREARQYEESKKEKERIRKKFKDQKPIILYGFNTNK